jgi:rfaE bifunctional protein kinase chain/domain
LTPNLSNNKVLFIMALDVADFKALSTARVLVFGDSMLDRYWVGDVNRISPEAPVPVVAVSHTEERVGGAANVARNVADMQGKAGLVSVVGDDEAGRCVESLLADAGIAASLVVDSTIRTTVKLRIVSRNQQLVRADFEDTPSKAALHLSEVDFSKALQDYDAVVLSDYGKGGLNHIQQLMAIAQEAGKPVYIDPKGAKFDQYKSATMITPNLSEFQQVVGDCSTHAEIDQKAQQLMVSLNIKQCLVTLSENGMLLCAQGKAAVHQSTRAREVYDVTGAGDTVIAMMALGAAARLTIEKTIELANHAAGVVVNKMGTATATQKEVKQSIARAKVS